MLEALEVVEQEVDRTSPLDRILRTVPDQVGSRTGGMIQMLVEAAAKGLSFWAP